MGSPRSGGRTGWKQRWRASGYALRFHFSHESPSNKTFRSLPSPRSFPRFETRLGDSKKKNFKFQSRQFHRFKIFGIAAHFSRESCENRVLEGNIRSESLRDDPFLSLSTDHNLSSPAFLPSSSSPFR